MKINLDDPRITAFALGELSGRDAVEIARAVRSDPRVSRAVDEVRQTASVLGDVFSDDGAEMLTAAQRDAIRSAGASPVITDIGSARGSVWKKASVAALGAAAAVVAGLWLVDDRAGKDVPDGMVDAGGIDWSQVDTAVLTAPVLFDGVEHEGAVAVSESAKQVSDAASEETARFRREVADRIQSASVDAADALPVLKAAEWHDPLRYPRLRVPFSSGASSWPWIKRYILDEGKLPPARAVRLEELINHFTYEKPAGLVHAGVQANVEICRTPWNDDTHLLAVHVKALPGVEPGAAAAELVIEPGQVEKIRLLGYADAVRPNPIAGQMGNPEFVSKTHGNYVLYEVELRQGVAQGVDFTAVSLDVAGERLLVNPPRPWQDASGDMRFASLVAATGMLLGDYPEVGALKPESLLGLCEQIKPAGEETDLAEGRASAIQLIKKAVELLEVKK